MIKIGVGSWTEAKKEAVKFGFEELRDDGFLPYDEILVRKYLVKSGISDRPMSLEETMQGARNRALEVVSLQKVQNDYALGLEGGGLKTEFGLLDIGVVWIIEIPTGLSAVGMTPAHQMGPRVEAEMNDGVEMSDAVAHVFGTNTIENRDCSGPITGGVLNVVKFYQAGVIAAFASLRAQQVEPRL